MEIDGDDMGCLVAFMKKNAAVTIDRKKRYLANSRLAPIAKKRGYESLGALMKSLRQGRSSLLPEVIEAMTTHETSFFRDVHPFESMRNHVFPEIRSRIGASEVINTWCAAVSTGQEAYSVAMLIRESWPAVADRKYKILASDVAVPTLERAQKGEYSQLEVSRGLATKQLVKYFKPRGRAWQISDALRSMITFQKMNLLDDWPFAQRMHVVLLRNVLIYFDAETKKKVFLKLARQMAPGGYLLLGAAETSRQYCDDFDVERHGQTLWHRLKIRA